MNIKHAVVIALGTMGASAHAVIDATVLSDIKASVLADVATASGTGFAVMGVVLAASIGMSLLGTFVRKGASGG